MPLTLEDRRKIVEISREFGVKKLWIFGSALDADSEPNDIDLAVEGIPSDRFFKYYGRLFDALSKPVDLVDMDSEAPIRHIVRKRGRVIFDE